MIDGQMTVEDVIADIQGNGIGYIIVQDIAYEGTTQISRDGEIGEGPSKVYLSRPEAQVAAKQYNAHGDTFGTVWEIDLSDFQLREKVLPAERISRRGESEKRDHG